jgi:PAS domain S-box-containing protein
MNEPASETGPGNEPSLDPDALHRLAQLESIFLFSNDGIFLFDPDLNEILDVNPRACQMLGYTKEEFFSLPVSVIFPDHMARLQAFALSLAEAGRGWIDEVVCQTRTGDLLDVELSASESNHAPGQPSCIIALLRDISERKAAAGRAEASLHEKEVLLREIHHRVKNNLQIVSSLIDLQATKCDDPEALAMLRECGNRVRSMAIIHEKLYQTHDLARIAFDAYVGTLISELFRSHGAAESEIQVEIDTNQISLDINSAVPCGLIVNELVSNSLKYAWSGGGSPDRGATLQVQLASASAGQLALRIADNGCGLPGPVDLTNSSTLGLRLVSSLVRQLDGEIEVDTSAGTSYTIEFPAERGSLAKVD